MCSSGDDGAARRGQLTVTGLGKRFATRQGDVDAVNDVSFTVEPGQFFTLLGPSGCGKSTTLRCIAGLERADEGRIVEGDRVLTDVGSRDFVPASERNFGMVFQSYAIWPHMTVFQNVAFPLRANRRRHRLSRNEIAERVDEALAVVRLEGFGSRTATKLSGGQQQRLALARALVTRPSILLLDEPLSNLDAGLREHMRGELRAMQQRTGVTTLYVTHDQAEAFSMSDVITVMDSGRVVQQGAPREIYARPSTAFVATFVGRTNLLKVEQAPARPAATSGAIQVSTRAGVILVNADSNAELGTTNSIVIRPEDVQLWSEPPPVRESTVLRGVVRRPTFLGESVELEVEVGDELLVSRQHSQLLLATGDQVYVELPTDRCTVVSGEAAGVGAHIHAKRTSDEAEVEE